MHGNLGPYRISQFDPVLCLSIYNAATRRRRARRAARARARAAAPPPAGGDRDAYVGNLPKGYRGRGAPGSELWSCRYGDGFEHSTEPLAPEFCGARCHDQRRDDPRDLPLLQQGARRCAQP